MQRCNNSFGNKVRKGLYLIMLFCFGENKQNNPCFTEKAASITDRHTFFSFMEILRKVFMHNITAN